MFNLQFYDFNLYIKLFEALKRSSISLFNVKHAKLEMSVLDSGMASPLILAGKLDEYSLKFLRPKLRANMTILDVGAHVGFYSTFFKKSVSGRGKIYCFEPDIFNFSLLQKNIDLNKITNATLENLAVSQKSGISNFFTSLNNFGDHHLYNNKNFNGIRKVEKVKTVSIDHYLKDDNRKIDLVKIDVQGVEPLVVNGMKKLIRRQKHISIFMELWPKGYVAAGFSPEEFITDLTKKKFLISAVTRGGEIIQNVRSYDQVKMFAENEEFLDLYCEK